MLTLRSGDDGFSAILHYWSRENQPVKFNYQGYQWYSHTDDLGRYFYRENALESVSGYGHEDRPYRPDGDVPSAE